MKNYLQLLCALVAVILLVCAFWVSPRKRALEAYQAGERNLAEGSNQAALDDFSEAIKRDPQFVPAYLSRANIEVSRKDIAGALADWTKVIKLEPTNEAVLLTRGGIRLQLKDFTGAASDGNNLIQLDPTNARAFLIRGASRYYLNDFTGASNDLNMAVALAPDDTVVRDCRGLLRANQRDWEGAKEDFTEAIRANAYDATAYQERAAVEIIAKDYEKGLDDASNAIRLAPGNFQDAYHLLAHVKFRLKDNAGALAEANQLVKLAPSDAASYFARADIETFCDDFSGASNDLEKAALMSPTNTSIYTSREMLEQKCREPDAALADLDRILALDPHSFHVPEIYEAMGYAREELHQWRPALEDFHKGMAGNSPPDDIPFETFLLQCRLGETQQAMKDLDAHIRSIPASKINDWTTSIANFLAGNLNENEFLAQATTKAKRPTDISSQTCDAYYFQGMEHLLAGDKAGAAERFQECINTREDNSYNYMNAITELDDLKNH